MTIEMAFHLYNVQMGDSVDVTATVIVLGGNAATAYRSPRPLTDEERAFVEEQVENALRRETGHRVTKDGSETCASATEKQAAMRRYLGGGRG
jgi:hypothetical protein